MHLHFKMIFYNYVACGIISGIITANAQRDRDNDFEKLCSEELL